MAKAYHNNPIPELQFHIFAILLPIIFGILNIIVNNLPNLPFDLPLTPLNISKIQWKYLIFGLFVGFAFSNYGTRIKKYPTKLFGLSYENRNKFLYIAPFIYAFIWGFGVYYTNYIMNLI